MSTPFLAQECPRCKGSGKVPHYHEGDYQRSFACAKCRGAGIVRMDAPQRLPRPVSDYARRQMAAWLHYEAGAARDCARFHLVRGDGEYTTVFASIQATATDFAKRLSEGINGP